MVPPDSSFHLQARSRKASRPRSWRVLLSASSRRSRITCTAIEAWSVPGTHSVLYPSIRLVRIRMSCSVLTSAWPRWSEPVTLGGGITMQ